MLKKLLVALAPFLISAQAFAAFSQPIFQIRGTALKPYYSAGSSVYTTGKPGSGAPDAAVLSLGTAGVFGSSVLDVTSSSATNARFLRYAAVGNVPSTSAMSYLWRIVPLWTGSPSTIQTLVLAGDTDAAINDVIVNITTLAKLKIEITTKTGADAVIFSTVNSLSFTNGTPTDIMFTWDGTTTTGAVKIYQDGSLVEADTANATVGVWDANQVLQFEIAKDSFDNNLARNNIYYLNEMDVFDSVQAAYAPRSTFVASLNQNGDHDTDPGAANVLSTAGTYYINGAPITPTYAPALPNASDLRSGVVVSSVTGTLAVPSPTQVLSGVATDNTVGSYITAATSTVKIGQTFGPSGSLTGTYDGSDRWTDPGLANVLSGVQYKANSLTNNETGTLLSVDPGVGNVLSGVNYSINSVGKIGTFSTSCSDPGFHNVKHGATYVFNSTLFTGDYRGADLWSDPIFNNVSNGVTYLADGVTMTGNLNSVNNVMAVGTLVAQVPGASKPQANSLTVTQGDDVAFNFVALTGPTNTPMSLSGATLTSYIEGVTYDNLHHAIANQGTNPGQFSLFLSASETAALKTGSNLEVITKVVQGGKTFYLHGVGVLRVLSPKPGLNYTSLDAGRARHRTVAHLGAVKHAA